jgi:hypothetical protein
MHALAIDLLLCLEHVTLENHPHIAWRCLGADCQTNTPTPSVQGGRVETVRGKA